LNIGLDETQSGVAAEVLEGLADLLAQLQELAAELPGEDGPLAQDADFCRRLRSLQIDLQGARALAARAGSDACLRSALSCRCRQLRTASAELVISSLGYYALPNPQPLLIDNEGPIGHHHALQMMLGLADYFQPDGPGGGEYGDRDAIARRIFGSAGPGALPERINCHSDRAESAD